MAEPLTVEVVSPEELLYSGEATMVITRTLGGGEIAFQSGHAPFLGALADNHTRVYLVDGTVEDIAVHGGFVEVSGDAVSVLSDVAETMDQVDVDRARAARDRAHAALSVDVGDIEAASALRRAEVRLTVSGASEAAAH